MKAMLPDKRARNVYNDVLRCEAPPPNLNFANIFYARFGAKPPNLMTANVSGYTVSTYSRSKGEVEKCHLLSLGFG